MISGREGVRRRGTVWTGRGKQAAVSSERDQFGVEKGRPTDFDLKLSQYAASTGWNNVSYT